jgi:hypothetical protein
MRNWMKVSVAVVLVLTLTTTVIIKASRSQSQAVQVNLDPKYLPGNPRPDESYCDSHMSWGDVQYCNEYPNTVAGVSYAFDRQKKMITHASTLGFGLTIGDLIALWGQLTGYRIGGWAVQVYWGNRSAYMVSQTFGPGSTIIFITYEYTSDSYNPWSGFISAVRQYRYR